MSKLKKLIGNNNSFNESFQLSPEVIKFRWKTCLVSDPGEVSMSDTTHVITLNYIIFSN